MTRRARRGRRDRGGSGRGSRRAPADRGTSHVGERHTVTVGPVAHGGHCVARVAAPGAEVSAGPGSGDHPATRVVFVRHALPGETVVARVTEGAERDRFWRADAVEVLTPSPDRVEPPCPYAGPGRCGGCDFQHVALARQRDLKADVVREQLRRVGRIDLGDLGLDPTVEPVPGDEDGLHWRTRIRLALDDAGRAGMRAYRSHRVVPLEGPEDCRIAARDALVELTTGATDADTLLGEPAWRPAGVEPTVETVAAAGTEHRFALAADGFWQAHPGAPAVLVEAVLAMLAPREGDRALDLYAGVGLFARFLADAVGPGGEVVAVEGDPVAAGHAADNLAGHPVRVLAGQVDAVLAAEGDLGPSGGGGVDLVVLDPPREGARREVVDLVAARAPRAVAYVACDPAALARDLRTFLDHGYRLAALRAFDAFPMTHHVEVVALLER